MCSRYTAKKYILMKEKVLDFINTNSIDPRDVGFLLELRKTFLLKSFYSNYIILD